MEFIEGPDLEELLKSPRDPIFSIKDVIKVADQLSNALAHCHKVGVKHGDIKSNNVKFNVHTGNYVLLDFGLAIMSDEQRRTSLRHAGAVEFMAPEQNAGEMLFQTDVYSFGVILYELLAGTVPFPLKDNGETARNTVMVSHMEKLVPDVLALRRDHLPAAWTKARKEREMLVPVWLLNVIAKCLEKTPEKRFATGMELHEAIVSDSTLAIKNNEADIDNTSVLQSENERLRNLVLQYQEAAEISKKKNIIGEVQMSNENGMLLGRRSAVRISRPVFLLLILLTTCLGVLAGSSLLNNKRNNHTVAHSDALIADSSTMSYIRPFNFNIGKNKQRDSAGSHNTEPKFISTSNTQSVSAKQDKNKIAENKPLIKKNNKNKKGKKFLDIKFIKSGEEL
jgi:serine/threonine protein kinase